MSPGLRRLRVTVAEEFQKNPDLTQEDLDELRHWLKTQKHLPENIPDTLLIMLHHSCYFDLIRTKETIEHYYTMRTSTPEFFNNRDITSPDLSKSMQVMNILTLPVPDDMGCWINYNGLRDTEPNNFIPEDGAKLIFMVLEANGVKYGTVPGYHAIFDMKGARLKHVARLSLPLLRKFVLYAEKALPLRRKKLHIVNAAPWFDKIIRLVKPWISTHTMDNLHVHTQDLESLYRYIPKECLPKELGGVLGSVDELNAANCRTLESLCDYFTEEEQMRVDKSQRGKNTDMQNSVELETKLEPLEID